MSTIRCIFWVHFSACGVSDLIADLKSLVCLFVFCAPECGLSELLVHVCVAVFPGFRDTDTFLSVCLRICILLAGRVPDMRSLICSLCVFQGARFVNGLGVHFAGLYVRELFEGMCPRLGCEVSHPFLCLFPSM